MAGRPLVDQAGGPLERNRPMNIGSSCVGWHRSAWTTVLALAPVVLVPGPLHAGVVPDNTGTIAEILLQYDPDVDDGLAPLYRDLFAVLPVDVAVTVICPSEEAVLMFLGTYRRPAMAGGRELRVIDAGLPISIWARDRLIARQDRALVTSQPPFIPVRSAEYEDFRDNELVVGELLPMARLALRGEQAGFHLEGGNVVSNRRHVFLGANVLAENSGVSVGELDAGLRHLSEREYLLLGNADGRVPWLHADMYLTPVSEELVLVASTFLGADLAGLPCGETEYATESADAEPLLELDACPDEAMEDRLDDVVSQLAEEGYRVDRLPALAETVESWMLTYNNVLMEERGGRRIVYMPYYGVSALDEAAASAYEREGLEVRPVDVRGVYRLGGALRCTVNVLRRRPDRPCAVGAREGAMVGGRRGSLKMFRLGEVGPLLRDRQHEREVRRLRNMGRT